MKRGWLICSILVLALVGLQWPGNSARGQSDSLDPSMDMGSGGQSDCPYVEKMRAYGECPWYYDQEYHHGATADMGLDEATGDVVSTPEAESVEAATEALPVPESPAASAAVGPADCWYDGETDSYYHYEFSNANTIREETADTATEEAESYAAEEMDSAALETMSDAEFYADESYVEEVCREPATATDGETMDTASEEAWRRDYGYEGAYPSEGTSYPYGDETDTEMVPAETAGEATSIEDMYTGDDDVSDNDGAWDDGETAEYADSADAMDETETAQYADSSDEMDETETAAPPAESLETWPSDGYDYKYGEVPYRYDMYQPSNAEPAYTEPTYSEPGYSEPIQAWEDADVDVVEGEDSEDAAPASTVSETVEYDSEMLLSLARTLDRVGSTLQCLSQYLTEMATADLAQRHGETIER